jgi:predicted MFS family arabinose efflux permease
MTDPRPTGGRRAFWLTRQLPEPGPTRVLALATLISTIGTGLFITSSVLYFTRAVHLPATQVGIGLTVAGLIGLLAGIPVGEIADRRDPRQVQLVTLVLMAVTMACYVFVNSFAVFAIVATVDMLAASASNAARGGLIYRVGGERAAAFRSQLRAISNVGISVGALGAGVAIQLDTRLAYQVLVLLNALSFVVCALVYLRLPNYPPIPRPREARRWLALRDWPFVAYTAINGAMSLQYFVLSLPLPIWIASHTTAPRWTVAAVMLINTFMCVFLQVNVGSKVDTIRKGSAAMRTAGLIFVVSCALMALLADMPVWVAALLVVVAVVVHTFGEMWHAAATFALGFDLAPGYAQAQYQGLLHIGFGAGQAIAPVVLISLCIGLGQPGWLLLGGIFAVIGLVAGPVARWAERTRPKVLAEEPQPAGAAGA